MGHGWTRAGLNSKTNSLQRKSALWCDAGITQRVVKRRLLARGGIIRSSTIQNLSAGRAVSRSPRRRHRFNFAILWHGATPTIITKHLRRRAMRLFERRSRFRRSTGDDYWAIWLKLYPFGEFIIVHDVVTGRSQRHQSDALIGSHVPGCNYGLSAKNESYSGKKCNSAHRILPRYRRSLWLQAFLKVSIHNGAHRTASLLNRAPTSSHPLWSVLPFDDLGVTSAASPPPGPCSGPRTP